MFKHKKPKNIPSGKDPGEQNGRERKAVLNFTIQNPEKETQTRMNILIMKTACSQLFKQSHRQM